MLKKRTGRARCQVEVPLTSLIDMVFLLLIYFLLTTNFMVDEGIKVNLPEAKAAESPWQTNVSGNWQSS